MLLKEENNIRFKIMDSKKQNCSGLFFRGYNNLFIHKGRIERKERLRFLSRLSCDGINCSARICDYMWFWDNAREAIANGSGIIIPKIENKALYSVKIINISRDWETGIVDDWDIEFYKVKENG